MKKKRVENTYSNVASFKIDAKEADYLYIKNSQITGSGKGLFTAIPIYKDEVICLFKGELLSDPQARTRSKKGQDAYFINLPDGRILDSMHVKCFARYANDSLGFVKTAFRINSIISLDEEDNVCIISGKNIKAGEEIFCSYGKAYWKKFRERIV